MYIPEQRRLGLERRLRPNSPSGSPGRSKKPLQFKFIVIVVILLVIVVDIVIVVIVVIVIVILIVVGIKHPNRIEPIPCWISRI